MDILLQEQIDSNDFELCEDIEKGERVKFLRGIVARADYPNQNKRVYPKSIMEESLDLIKPLVESKRFVGELDHANCYAYNTFKVLTEKGWKDFPSLKIGERVATMGKNKTLEYQPIQAIVDKPYKGIVYHIKSRNIDSTVTPEHRFYIEDRYGKIGVFTVEEIYRDRIKFNKSKIIKTFNFVDGKEDDYFTIQGINEERFNNRFKNDVRKDLKIKTSTFMKFLGIWLAEGNLGSKNRIFISQKEGEKAQQIREMLKEFPEEIEWKEYKYFSQIIFYTTDIRLYNYLKPLGLSETKHIPQEVKEYSSSFLAELIDWFILGDGRNQGRRKNLFSISKRLVEDLQECLIKAGGSGNWTFCEPKDKTIRNKEVKKQNCHLLYQLNLSTVSGIYLDNRFVSIEQEEYEGNIYCLTVENGNFYINDKGKSYLTGNSPRIALDRIALYIPRIQMNEDGVVTADIYPTSTPCGDILKGLMSDGVKIGFSTRATGSVKPYKGTLGEGLLEVNKGMRLISIDAVMNPSVKDALPDLVTESHIYLGQTTSFKKVWNDIFGK